MTRRPGSRIGLACAGGVVEGAFYEMGVLCALNEAIAGLDLNHLDVYVGVSAGAILTACLANGIPPRHVARALLSDRSPDALAPERVFSPAFGEYGRRAAQLPGRVVRALRDQLARPSDLSPTGVLLKMAGSLPVGLFDNRPLERHLARVFAEAGRTNDFRKLSTELRVVAVNLDTAELVAFGDADTEHVPISRAVQASTALPLVYTPVEIDGQYYIDGVARRTLNASQALSEGVELLFCVNPIVPIDLRVAGVGTRRRSLVEGGLPSVLSQTFRTMIHSRRVAGFKNYEYAFPDADVVLIEPETGDARMFYSNIFSFSNRHAVMEHGYATARGYLLRHAAALDPLLERHGLRLERDRLRGRGPLLDGRPASTKEVLDRTDRTLDALEEALRHLDAPVPPPAA